MKKLLALMLSAVMVFTMGTSVFAYTDVEEGTYVSEAVTVLSNLGILDGYTDGTFKPDAIVTRAEMAKIICETLGYNTLSAGTTSFEDVAATHWAAGYINMAHGLGIINGYGNGKFGPEDTVTYEQAVKMIVCALGYEPLANANGGWPTGYVNVGANIGITKNAVNSARGDIAVLIYNAINVPVMEQTSFGFGAEYEILDGTGNKNYKTILTKRDVYIAIGIVGELRIDEIGFTITKDSKDKEFVKDDKEIFNIGNTCIADYVHQEVEVYVAKDDYDEYTVIAVKAAKKTETFTVVSDDIEKISNNKIEYYVDALNSSKTKTLTINDNATVEYNKEIISNTSTIATNLINEKVYDDDTLIEDIEIVLIDNNGDKDYDAVVMTKYTSERLTLVDSYRDKIILNGKTVTFDFDDKEKTYIFIDEKGNELTLSDFDEDDVVAYVMYGGTDKDPEYLKLIKLSNSVIEGSISSTYGNDNTVTINNEEYKVAAGVWDKYDLEVGMEGYFYIGITGKIIEFDGSLVRGKYGYILGSYIDRTFDDEIKVRLLTSKGIDTYTVKDTVEVDDNLISTGVFDTARFVEYKINSQGLISSLKPITITDTFDNKEYNGDTEILYGNYIDENTQVFVLDSEDYRESFVTDMDYLVDESSYDGAMYIKNGDVKVLFITSSNTVYDEEIGFAIVTHTNTTVIDDDVVFAVDYVQDEIEGTIYFEDEPENLVAGTVFVFNADSKGFVKTTDYDIVATIVEGDFAPMDYNIEDEPFGKEVVPVFGYIENTERKTNAKGELITVNDITYVITTNTNKYTYDDSYRYKIETEDFLSGDAYYADEDYKTPVMLKLVDGVVVDIYTISSRIPK